MAIQALPENPETHGQVKNKIDEIITEVDTSGGPVVATVHPTVKSAWFGDYGSTWTNANNLTVVTTEGNLIFNNSEQGKRYQIIKAGAGWRIYNADGSLYSTLV